MKVAVTAKDNSLDAAVDPRFGRCRYFLIVDTETLSFDSLSNEAAMAAGGAGIQAAQSVIKTGISAVITGNVGPNAYRIFAASNIPLYTGATGTVKQAIEQYNNGALHETKEASVGSHFGMGGRRGGRSF